MFEVFATDVTDAQARGNNGQATFNTFNKAKAFAEGYVSATIVVSGQEIARWDGYAADWKVA